MKYTVNILFDEKSVMWETSDVRRSGWREPPCPVIVYLSQYLLAGVNSRGGLLPSPIYGLLSAWL